MEATTVTMLVLGAMALLVPAGAIIYGCGLSRSKNAAAAIVRGVLVLATGVLVFWFIGDAILESGGGTLIGLDVGRVADAHGRMNVVTLVSMAMVAISVAPLAGALGERARVLPVCLGAGVLAGVVLPICGYWAWSPASWLNRVMGERFYDSAGAGVALLTSGIVAAVGIGMVGPRTGKYNTDGSSNFIPGHSVPLASAGVLLMVVGWVPFLVGNGFIHGGSSAGGD